MSRTSSENTSINYRIKKTNRLVAFNYSSSTSSTNKFQVPTTTTNTSIKNTGIILQKSDSKQKLQGKTAVVYTKFENFQWSLLDSVSQSSADKKERHPEKGWGVVCQGISTGEQCLKEEQLLRINVLELKAVKLALLTFNKQKSLKAVHFQIDNITLWKWGNREPNDTETRQRNLAVSFETPDHN